MSNINGNKLCYETSFSINSRYTFNIFYLHARLISITSISSFFMIYSECIFFSFSLSLSLSHTHTNRNWLFSFHSKCSNNHKNDWFFFSSFISVSVWFNTFQVGTIGGTYLAALFIHHFKSWHQVFYIFGISSIVWCLLFVRFSQFIILSRKEEEKNIFPNFYVEIFVLFSTKMKQI